MKCKLSILFFAGLALGAAVPFSQVQAQQLTEERLAQVLKRFPKADLNGDGKLTPEEFKAARQQLQRSRQRNARQQSQDSEQRNARQAAAARAIPTFDPGWEKDEFPPHAVSLKTPEEIMAIYKRGESGRTYADSRDAMSFPKPDDGILRIVGTGHSFTAPGYRTFPSITRAAGFEQPLSLHNGGGRTGSVSYKWEQENGIFEFDGKPLPKLLAAISNAEWEGMIWGPYTADRPKFYTSWIDFCERYNPGMKYFLIDAWPTLGQVQMQYKRKGNPESESFFTDEVFDELNDAANKTFAELVTALRETSEKVYILPTNAAMTEAAKRFNRGELPGVQGLYKVVGGKEYSIWNDQRGHLGPGFDRLEGYVFYATIYGKSPELISEPIKFKNNPSFMSEELDKIFREIAWKAVVEHPLSGVTDENGNGIGDHLE
ncbi:hypothetical protein [Pelagicoccus mobilis]|uniref:EF-hand domain-containing protein n=1 Tax=Pelagicoccus mobilis TaxID=415221 RepID=A0A934S2V7_9BACT|nr:hypothetical protein [Pelagicoccus mobilis]MBK1879646.1 hypothetical protein [Pelagicoccus mobilis]